MDLQRASMWKRISAWLFDGILTASLAVGFAFVLSLALGYDGYSAQVDTAYEKYETQYGINFNISQEEYLALPEQTKQLYDAAYAALIADEAAMHAYNMVVNISLLIVTIGILLSIIGLEFVVPLFFGNGQTLGKKVFGIGLMRTDGVRMNTMQLFVRTLLGKYTVETMIPVYIVIMLFWGTMDITGTVIIGAILLAQVILVGVTRNRSAIHDLLAGTVAVDIASQRIFASSEELLAYTKKIHAEQAARQTY